MLCAVAAKLRAKLVEMKQASGDDAKAKLAWNTMLKYVAFPYF